MTRLGVPKRKMRTQDEIREQERRVAILNRALVRHGGRLRFSLVSKISVSAIDGWRSGSRPIGDEYIGAIEKFAE